MNDSNFNEPTYVFISSSQRIASECCAVILDRDGQTGEMITLPFYPKGIITEKIFYLKDEPYLLKELQDVYDQKISYQDFLLLLHDSLVQCQYQTSEETQNSVLAQHIANAFHYKAEKPEAYYSYQFHFDADALLNVYLHAVSCKDSSLIYNLYAASNRQQLGKRSFYMKHWYHELENHQVIRSYRESHAKNNDCHLVKLLVIAPNQKLLNIEMYMETVTENDGCFLKKVLVMDVLPAEQEAELLLAENFAVRCYRVQESLALTEFFGHIPEVIISGEFAQGTCYKWLKTIDILKNGANLAKQYRAQIILTERQAIIYSDDINELEQIDYLLKSRLTKFCSLETSGYDTLGNIYREAIVNHGYYQP